MRRPVARVALAVLAALAAGFWAWSGPAPARSAAPAGGDDPFDMPSAEAQHGPRLTSAARMPRPEGLPGTGPAREANAPQPAPVRGTVLDPEGRPLAGAEVLLLPRHLPGLDLEDLEGGRHPRTRTAQDGTFSIARRAGVAADLVASAPGFLPGTAPLDDVARATPPLAIRLGRPWRVALRVEGPEGDWPEGCEVDVASAPPGAWDRAVDPRHVFTRVTLRADPDRRAERAVDLATRSPLRIAVQAPAGLASVPRSLTLEHPASVARFRLVPSGRVSFTVSPAPGSPTPAAAATVGVCLRSLDSREAILSFTQRSRHVSITSGLSPGRYLLEVRVTGCLPLDREFEIREPGAVLESVVALEARSAARTPGRVLLRVLPDPGGPRPGVWFRRSGEQEWHDAHARRLQDGRLELSPQGFDLQASGLLPGEYDLLVTPAGRPSGVLLSGMRVFGDQDNEFEVSSGR